MITRSRLASTAALIASAALLPSGTPAASAAPTTTATAASTAAAAAAPSGNAKIRLHRWTGSDLRQGRHRGTTVRKGRLHIARPSGQERVRDPYGNRKPQAYQRAHWVSPWRKNGFRAANLVPSWTAKARRGTLVRVEVRVASGKQRGSWDQVALWGFAHQGVRPHSGAAQPDDLARLSTDTVTANPGKSFTRWQVRISLLRPKGTNRTPKVTSVSGVAADRSSVTTGTSRTTMRKRVRLELPSYSQMVHRGHHPEWGGGGEAWCSPTSMAMVVQHFGTGPKPTSLRFEKGVDPRVDHAARHTYDHRYRGTGNWPFTTAYAGNFGLDAFVTRLRSLRDAEKLVRHGVPVVVSIKFGRGELDGAPISTTNGHLLVISGFRKNGTVIVHDPAAPHNGSVHRAYKRGQLERAWLRGSGGIAYVVHPVGKQLPKGNRW